jgi:tetratricopeptide (TPR) repeat protein
MFQGPYYQDPIYPQREMDRIEAQVRAEALLLEDWSPTVMLYTELGALNCLIQPLEILVKHFPDSPGFSEALLIAYATQGQDEAAIAIGEQALQRFPNQPSLYFNLAIVQANRGRIDQALNLLITSLELGLDSKTQYWQHMMRWLQALHPDGRQVLRILIEKADANPESKALKLLIAMQWVRLGQLDQAAVMMRQMPDHFTNQDVQTFLQHMESFTP